MARVSFSDGLAIGGGILAIVLVVLDKAGKLKGPLLLALLGSAAGMAIPLLWGISWVADAPPGLALITRRMLMIFLLATAWAGLSVWIVNGNLPESSEKPKPDNAAVIPLSDPIIHFEPERVVVWSTGPNQKAGEFHLTLSNTGTEAIDHISVDEDYFVALKSQGGMVIKNVGGVPINSEVCEELESKKSCPVFVSFSPSIEVMNEVVKNNGLPSLRGVRLTFRYRRKADGKDYRVVRGYGVIGPHAEGLICAGAPGDPAPIELRNQFVTVSEIIPYLDLSQYWTTVTHAIGQVANDKLTNRYY